MLDAAEIVSSAAHSVSEVVSGLFTKMIFEMRKVTQLFHNLRYDTLLVRNGKKVGVVMVGRNDPCTCGNGKKYKKCCGKTNVVDISTVIDEEQILIRYWMI